MHNNTGSNNTANGRNALFSNTGNNTAVGVGAGSSLTTGDNISILVTLVSMANPSQ